MNGSNNEIILKADWMLFGTMILIAKQEASSVDNFFFTCGAEIF